MTVSGGNISIAEITGDIVITAVATEIPAEPEPAYNNLAIVGGEGWGTGKRLGSDGTFRDLAGCITTNYIKVPVDAVIRIQGMDLTAYNMSVCNSLKANISAGKFADQTAYFSGITATATGGQATAIYHTEIYVRFSGMPTNGADNIIITINEEIV